MQKHFDNSREGNDCFINEHWYFIVDPQECAIKVTQINGWCEDPLRSTLYEDANHIDMPNTVREWFNEKLN